MALQGIYSSQHHCDVVWNDTTDLLIWCVYIYIYICTVLVLTTVEHNYLVEDYVIYYISINYMFQRLWPSSG